jgi:rRNA maturation endonuclease Nob1
MSQYWKRNYQTVFFKLLILGMVLGCIDTSVIKVRCQSCDTWFPYGGDITRNTKVICPKCGINIREPQGAS